MSLDPFEPAGTPVLSERWRRALAGCQAGFLGGLLTVAWYCVHSRMAGEYWWTKLNVAAGLFHGTSVYTMGPGRATWAGAALLLVAYGALGVLFGFIAPTGGAARAALLAIVYSTLLGIAADKWFWRIFDPFAPAYFPFAVVLAGHLLYSLVLGAFPIFFRALTESAGAGGPVEPPVQPESGSVAEGETPTAPPHC